MSDTPRVDRLTETDDFTPGEICALAELLERESAARLAALRAIWPFVEEDDDPRISTEVYRHAIAAVRSIVEAAKETP